MDFIKSVNAIKKTLDRNKHFKHFSRDMFGYSFHVTANMSNDDFFDSPHKYDGELKAVLKKYGFEIWGGGCSIPNGGCGYEYHCGPNIVKFRKIMKNAKKKLVELYKQRVANIDEEDMIAIFHDSLTPAEFSELFDFKSLEKKSK